VTVGTRDVAATMARTEPDGMGGPPFSAWVPSHPAVRARVVKSLNTMAAPLMVNPARLSGADHSVFVSGNDAEAKKTVTGLLAGFGHRDIIDLGDISTARGAEMVMPIWLRLMGALSTPMFNFKIVR
jgi:predicted dinucleotide-binding enzyme